MGVHLINGTSSGVNNSKIMLWCKTIENFGPLARKLFGSLLLALHPLPPTSQPTMLSLPVHSHPTK